MVDIRFEDQVSRAVEQAVEKFGGIDILVNNASAISLTGTVNTDMKRYSMCTCAFELCACEICVICVGSVVKCLRAPVWNGKNFKTSSLLVMRT